MQQPHFLLSAAARTLSLREAFALTDEQAFALFGEVRWGRDADPVCPSCGVAEQHWFLASRRQWRCVYKPNKLVNRVLIPKTYPGVDRG